MKTEAILEKKWMWTDEYYISSYEVDARGKASLPTLSKFMQESAYNHANHLEFGYHQLKEKNLFWVLSRLSIKIDRYPQWGDKIKLCTWSSGVERLLAFRDFRLLDEQGAVIAAAVTAWLILDAHKRRPQRTDELKARVKLLPDQRALEERPVKIPGLSHPTMEGAFFPVRCSDLDLYNHVNNAKYIEWILDSFPGEMHREFAVAEFEINFLAEARIGDEAAIHTEKLKDAPLAFAHCIKRKADNRDICLARTAWKKNNEPLPH
jgi:medium-chain acyl-[acyl-carrier-protein] hydrolase